MLLLVDAGNTRIKWALADPHLCVQDFAHSPAAWLAHGSVFHAQLEQLDTDWRSLPISNIMVSNVAGFEMRAALQERFDALSRLSGLAPTIHWFASTASAGGVRNGYREPSKLGCDRFAALVGARALWPAQALIVATCGTATTVDALSAQGTFIGGMILPGLATMAQLLAQRTAQLPRLDMVDIEPPELLCPPLLADHTEAAIRSGCLAAQAGAIEKAVHAHQQAHCILSGGAAQWILPYLKVPATLVDNLVLTGLRVIAPSSLMRKTGAIKT